MRSYKDWSEAFAIFYKYEESAEFHVQGEHDVIYAGPNPEIVSAEDVKRLEELGWYPDDCECFSTLT